MMSLAASLLAWCWSVSVAASPGPGAGRPPDSDVVRPEARAATAPVPHHEDAADDPAICLGYTVVSRPPGVRTQNVFSFAFATERSLAGFDAVAEVMGHTSAAANGGDPDASDAVIGVEPETGGEELVGTLGGRYHLSDRVVLSLGVSYDNDCAVHIRPGFSLKLR